MPNNGLWTITGPLALQNVSLSLPGTVAPPEGPTLLFSTNFASGLTGIQDSHTGFTRYATTTSDPPPGKTHSLRMNLKDGVTDPITGLVGDNYRTADLVPTVDVHSQDQVTWVLPFRLDDFLWGGFAGADTGMNGKLVYMAGTTGSTTENGFYLSGAMGGSSGNLNCGDNGGGTWTGWQNESYGWNASNGSPTTAIYGSTGQAFGTDGQWHELRVQFDYHNSGAGYGRARVVIDGNVVNFSYSNSTDGWFNLPPQFRCNKMRLFYADDTSVNAATSRTGTAAGLQWGDAEVWQGIVDAVAPVWSQNFDTDMAGFYPFHTPSSVARVTSNPYSGAYCLRGNVKHGTVDGVTGLLSPDGRTVDCRPPNLRQLTTSICVHRYKFRMDNANWLTSTGAAAEIKMGYWSDTQSNGGSSPTTMAFWPVLHTGKKRVDYVYFNGGGGWLGTEINTAWTAGANLNNVYLVDHGFDVGPGTGWHTFEIHFDYENHVFQMYIDGVQLVGKGGEHPFADGNFYLGTTFRLDEWRPFYSGNSLSMSTDGTGYACGWQVDSVEFFDEVP